MGLSAARADSIISDRLLLSDAEQLSLGKQVLQAEAAAILELSGTLDNSFADAAQRIRMGRGSVIVCGMGKAGLIGKKLAATFASTGTPSHFVHPAEAVHGDLGRIGPTDIVLMLSFSGETEEVCECSFLHLLQEEK